MSYQPNLVAKFILFVGFAFGNTAREGFVQAVDFVFIGVGLGNGFR